MDIYKCPFFIFQNQFGKNNSMFYIINCQTYLKRQGYFVIMSNVVFFVRHFTERGTEVAIYDYAHHNETLLHNKSYIVCFTEQAQQMHGFPTERASFDKFNSRFEIIFINDIGEMSDVINKYKIKFFYTLTHGGPDIYQFHNRDLWENCVTIKHCVFNTLCQEADYYVAIGQCLNEKYDTIFKVIPHMVSLPDCSDNMRKDLGIPEGSIVLGRHGGFNEFNVDIAHEAIARFLQQQYASNVYFVFMNTQPFFVHPNIIYLDKNTDVFYKTRFINTCDAMIHARSEGETFGLSVAEFSIKNKPIITFPGVDTEHVKILGDKAIQYNSVDELLDVLLNIRKIITSRDDWNAYSDYSPANVMELFDVFIFSKK